MNVINSAILGAVQGITEFLPISSSGHLVLLQKLLPNFSQPGILFDVVVHLGTLFAVVYFFRKKIMDLSMKYFLYVFVATIPVVVVGFLFASELESMFVNPKYLGYEFLITAFINFLIDVKIVTKNKLNFSKSFLIGISQAVAIIPAISRSGATIFTGVRLGIDKAKAAEFSFLISIPAILGANILQLTTHRGEASVLFTTEYFVGFLTAFIIGFFSIGVVIKFLKEGKFKIFGWYSLILGLIIIFWSA